MRKILIAIVLVLSFLTVTTIALRNPNPAPSYISSESLGSQHHIDFMPVVPDHPYAIYSTNLDPIENRSEAVRKWLAPSLKISVQGGSGSGTIIYYNDKDGYAYIQSCGHLWNGRMSGSESNQRRLKCTVTTWYHNEKKLSASKTYDAEVLYYSNQSGTDSSLLRFKPDWIPTYFPIAEKGYALPRDLKLHSTGCDDGREVAHYDVKVVGYKPSMYNPSRNDLVTSQNSPRPGRSGGGLISEDGYYVGICWGTSDKTGNGIGLFTPLDTIREMNTTNGYDWLNEVGYSLARKIPVQDRNNPQGKYPKDYIPLPGR